MEKKKLTREEYKEMRRKAIKLHNIRARILRFLVYAINTIVSVMLFVKGFFFYDKNDQYNGVFTIYGWSGLISMMLFVLNFMLGLLFLSKMRGLDGKKELF